MAIKNYELSLQTTAGSDILDLTAKVQELLKQSGINNGSITVFIPGSTAAVTAIEYESGVLNDLVKAIERLAPEGIGYDHNRRWGDGNGYAHVRAALLKPSLNIPVMESRLMLGTWQQIVLIDFDNRPRQRRVLVQIMGDGV